MLLSKPAFGWCYSVGPCRLLRHQQWSRSDSTRRLRESDPLVCWATLLRRFEATNSKEATCWRCDIGLGRSPSERGRGFWLDPDSLGLRTLTIGFPGIARSSRSLWLGYGDHTINAIITWGDRIFSCTANQSNLNSLTKLKQIKQMRQMYVELLLESRSWQNLEQNLISEIQRWEWKQLRSDVVAIHPSQDMSMAGMKKLRQNCRQPLWEPQRHFLYLFRMFLVKVDTVLRCTCYFL